jgi:hypothetical protein
MWIPPLLMVCAPMYRAMPPAVAITLPRRDNPRAEYHRQLHRRAPGSNIEKSPRRLMRNLLPLPSLVLCLLALCLGAIGAPAQTLSGADVFSGHVTDLVGKPIGGAQVTTTASGSGVTRTTTTDQDGEYRIYFPGVAPQYLVLVKRMGFAPVQRTIVRHTRDPEHLIVNVELGGTPLALSMVEITGSGDIPAARATAKGAAVEGTVPNPILEILALRDTLHLSAVQMVGLGRLADTLESENSAIYRNVRALIAKSAAAGDANQMSGTVAIMLEDASRNTLRAVGEAKKVLRQEQWLILPPVIRDLAETDTSTAPRTQ